MHSPESPLPDAQESATPLPPPGETPSAAPVVPAEAGEMSFADGRVRLGPLLGDISIDGRVWHSRHAGVRGYRLLRLLAQTPGQIVAYEAISTAVWGEPLASDGGSVSLQAVRSAVNKIRVIFRDHENEDLVEETERHSLGDPVHGALRMAVGIGYCVVQSLADPPPLYLRPGAASAPGNVEALLNAGTPFADGRIRFCPGTPNILIDNRPARLTALEHKLLVYLWANAGKELAYAAILNDVWGTQLNEENACQDDYALLRTPLNGLRRKLGSELGDPRTGAIRRPRKHFICPVVSLFRSWD